MIPLLPLLSILLVPQAPQTSPTDLAAIRSELAALRAQQEALRKDVDAIKKLLLAAMGRPDDPSAETTLDLAGRPAKGSPGAAVVMIEFTDYQCPFCERYFTSSYAQIDRNYVQTGKVRYVVKNLPLDQIHPQAFGAAVAALCAGDQGRYWEMHDRLFGHQKQLEPDQIEAHAAALHLDVPRFKACTGGSDHEAMIRADIKEAMDAGVNGTPVFFLAVAQPGADTVKTSKVIIGAQPYSVFQSEIDALLAQVK